MLIIKNAIMKPIPKTKKVIILFLLIATFHIPYSQTLQQIKISVEGIEYGDPGFTALKEILQKNPAVKSVKPSFLKDVAILTVNYAGGATGLWTEVPAASKKHLKLVSIEEHSISLTIIKEQNKTPVAARGSKNNTGPIKSSHCFDCEYFPLCDGMTYLYTLTGTVGGYPIKFQFKEVKQRTINQKNHRGFIITRSDGIGENEQLNYYYCNKGEVLLSTELQKNEQKYVGEEYTLGKIGSEKPVYENHLVPSGKFTTHPLLNPNDAIGAKQIISDGSGFAGAAIETTLAAKNQTVIVQGRSYNEVLKIERIFFAMIMDEKKIISISTDYYAKGVGLIKSEKQERLMLIGDFVTTGQELLSYTISSK